MFTTISFLGSSGVIWLQFALFCCFFVGDLLRDELASRGRPGSKVGRPVLAIGFDSFCRSLVLIPVVILATKLSSSKWYLGLDLEAALALFTSCFLVGHWLFQASCGPLQAAHFRGASLSLLVGQSRVA
jgi:hypothetical protein